MKKLFFIFASIILSCNGLYSMPRPSLTGMIKPDTEKTVSPDKVPDLFLLGKIWGFLKYHHPNVTKGQFDWDNQQVKILPAYLSCQNLKERNTVLQKWIDSLGPVPQFNAKGDSVFKNAKLWPDYSWISKSKLSPVLVKALGNLTHNHTPGNQYYVEFLSDEGVNIPLFKHEKAYTDAAKPNLALRLLAVYKFWNIIEYWYPYKYLAKGGWDEYLNQFINAAILIKTDDDYRVLMQTMAASVKDTHLGIVAAQVEADNGKWGMPFTIRFLEGQAVVSSVNPKLLNGQSIRVGDVLNSVNGIPVSQLLENKQPYISASNKAAMLREAASLVIRTKDTISHIVIAGPNNQPKEMVVKNKRFNALVPNQVYDFPYQKDSSFFLLKSSILYINIRNLKRAQIPLLKPYLKTVEGIIFDDRQYPKEPAGDLIGDLLLPHKTAFAKLTSPVPGYPGVFTFTKPWFTGSESPDYFKGKVVILVNEETQSTGEFLAMSFRIAPNATVVGSTTAGADGNASPLFMFPGRYLFTQISSLGVYYPDGRETQQVGIVPDVKVTQTIGGLRAHQDDMLLKAILIIDNPGRKN